LAEGFWEQAVETYLALDRGLFLNPQYLIGEPGVWEAYPDFLAISFPENIVWMVEVTKTPSAGLFNKLSAFEKDYSWRIREQLVRHRIIRGEGDSINWTIGVWIVAPQAALPKLENRLKAAGVKSYQVASLEETTFPSWEKRFR